MKSRLTRPLLAVVVGGAVFAGSAAVAGPAFAAPVPDPIKVAADEPLPPTNLPKAVAAEEQTGGAGDAGNAGNTNNADTKAEPEASKAPDPAASSAAPDPGASSAAPNPGASSAAPNPGASSSAPNPGNPTTDTTKPSGKFSLSSSAPWIGQAITLTQVGVADNGVTDPAAVKRVVAWGDGTTSTLVPKQAPRKAYTKVGKFTITLSLTDAAGNKRDVSWPVNVTSPVKAAIDKSSVWHGQRFNVRFSNVPAGTTRITLRYGDGTGVYLPGKNQVVGGIYHLKPNGQQMPPGPVTLTAVYTNRLGSTSQVVIGRITIKNDTWGPRIAITKPKNANRISSWKTIRGTATDQGSGVYQVYAVPMRLTGSKLYCYTAKKTWIRVYDDYNLPDACGVFVRAVGGKWSLGLKGLQKGEFAVAAIAIDWASHPSNIAEASARITRS